MERTRMLLLISVMTIIIHIIPLKAHELFPYVTPPAWSPDGSRIAYVDGFDVIVSDVFTSSLLFTLTGHTDDVLSLSWSPDGTKIATASRDQSVKVWNSKDGALQLNLVGHNDSVSVVIWSPDSSKLVSFSIESNPSVFMWDSQNGDLIQTGDAGTTPDAAFSPTGKHIAISNLFDLQIMKVTDFQLWSSMPRRECCENQMYQLAWSPDGTQIVTGSIDGLITIWDAQQLTIIRQFTANPSAQPENPTTENIARSWVRDIQWNPDNRIQAVSGDGTVMSWDAATSAVIETVQLPALGGAAWSPYGGRLAVFALPSAVGNQSYSNITSETDTFRVIAPFVSSERFAEIAAFCNAPASLTAAAEDASLQAQSLESQGRALLARLDALPEGAIPVGCEADLRAIAEAMGSGG